MITALQNSLAFTGRTLGVVAREFRDMHAAAYVLGFFSLLSSLLALLRDRLFAHSFGAGPELDLYNLAFRIPDLLFALVGALVSVYVLIPILAAKDDRARRTFLDATIVGFSLFAGGLAACAAWFAPDLIRLLFPHAENISDIAALSRILLLQPIFLGFSNIAAAWTQFRRRFVLYAVSPLLYNVCIIVGVLFLYPAFGMKGLAWGVVLGALAHFGVQIPSLMRAGFLHASSLRLDLPLFFDVARLSLPRSLALALGQVTLIGLFSLATRLEAGSIAVFMFAFNLHAVPLTLVGASYSVAAFPTLAGAFSKGAYEEYLGHLRSASSQILFWSLPLVALMIVLRAHVVRAVLGSGAFDWSDTRLTAAALAIFSLSLVGQGLMLLFARACYAAGKTWAPFIVALVTTALAFALASIFTSMFQASDTGVFLQVLLRVEGVPGSDVLALVLAYSTAVLVGALLFLIYIEIALGDIITALRRAWWQGVTAAFAAGCVAYATLYWIGDVTLASTLGSIFLKGMAAGLLGLAAAGAMYYGTGSREFSEVVATFRGRLWRGTEPVSSAE